jgi:hypothetical protein
MGETCNRGVSLAEYLPQILALVWVVLGVLAGLALDRILLRRDHLGHDRRVLRGSRLG